MIHWSNEAPMKHTETRRWLFFMSRAILSRIATRLMAALSLLLTVAFTLFAPALAQPATPPIVELTLGASTQGRPITAVRIGDGPRKLALVGATHGWPERNTYELALQLIDHFRVNPQEVPPEISLYIIPLLNPDGYALQRRQNANVVDLNRNMDTSADACPENDWREVTEGARGIVGPIGGPYSESEVESRLIRDFLLDAWGVVWFHSNAGVVFPACDHEPSVNLARVYAGGAGYDFIARWDRYPITGGMHDWAGGLGIASITPELVTGHLSEFEQNLGGVRAILARPDLLPAPESRVEGGFEVDPIIWRAWRAWGGERLFGLPIAPPEPGEDGVSQSFERAILAYRPAQRDSTAVVQIALLGRELFESSAAPAQPIEGARFFPETGQNVMRPFADFWQIHGGLPIFGLPLDAEREALDEAGRPVIRQTFERAVLQRPSGAATHRDVTIAPLGRIQRAQADARAVESSVQAR